MDIRYSRLLLIAAALVCLASGSNGQDASRTDSTVINPLDSSLRDSWLQTSGEWTFNQDISLTGKGDSAIKFQKAFKTPFRFTCDVEVLDGMRPRILFGDTWYFANEGFSPTFGLYPDGGSGKHVPYEYNRRYTIRIDITSDSIEARVDDDLIDSRKAGMDVIPFIVFRGGDDWSPGSARFYNIRITDVPSAFGATSPIVSPSPPTPAPIVKLTQDQARAVVLIKGDNAEGTGFLIKTADGPVVVTNIHVISNNPNIKITTNTGVPVTILSYKGATDRDMAMIAIKDGDFKYLNLATDITGTVQPGDEVITPGNSEGGEVMLNTDGKVLGIGPDRVEFDNPIYHGNSGGPVIHVKSGNVIGIVTEAMSVDVSDELDKISFANHNSAITQSMRYFGFRLDNVPAWEPYDWQRFQNETAFLDHFDKRSNCLYSFLNATVNKTPDDTLYQTDEKIMRAINNCSDQSTDAAIAQRIQALRVLVSDLHDVADTDMSTMQNPNNFYSFDRQRVKDEITRRKALRDYLDSLSDHVDRLGDLPHTTTN